MVHRVSTPQSRKIALNGSRPWISAVITPTFLSRAEGEPMMYSWLAIDKID